MELDLEMNITSQKSQPNRCFQLPQYYIHDQFGPEHIFSDISHRDISRRTFLYYFPWNITQTLIFACHISFPWNGDLLSTNASTLSHLRYRVLLNTLLHIYPVMLLSGSCIELHGRGLLLEALCISSSDMTGSAGLWLADKMPSSPHHRLSLSCIWVDVWKHWIPFQSHRNINCAHLRCREIRVVASILCEDWLVLYVGTYIYML